MEVSGHTHTRPGRFVPGTRLTGGWVGRRTCPGAVETVTSGHVGHRNVFPPADSVVQVSPLAVSIRLFKCIRICEERDCSILCSHAFKLWTTR
jgi:hypothetical protein